MDEEQKIDKPTKQAWNIADVIGWLLFVNGFIFMQNGIIWMFQETGSKNWFSRVSMSMICFGISGIIFRLRK